LGKKLFKKSSSVFFNINGEKNNIGETKGELKLNIIPPETPRKRLKSPKFKISLHWLLNFFHLNKENSKTFFMKNPQKNSPKQFFIME